MTVVRIQHEPEQQRLFTGDGRPYCKTCRTTRANLCAHDADLQHRYDNGIYRATRRPKDCLNHPQNSVGVPY